jgi:hypothetical protein
MTFDLDYLNKLIAGGVEENPELEYKAAAALQRDDKVVMQITKDVSSMANSNGGILIYGIAEDQLNKHLPGMIDPVDRKIITKEWLEQILNFKIRPRIHGVQIHLIPITGNPDRVVYVLQIPKGETAHQAEDKRYYRRHNFMVEPLFDHEIRDIMGRQKNPLIVVDFEIRKEGNWRVDGTGKRVLDEKTPYSYHLDVYANNAGKIYAKYINVVLTLPEICIRGQPYDRDNQRTREMQLDNKVRDLVAPDSARYFQGPIAKPPKFGPARHEPLLPGMRMLLKSIAINEYSTDIGNRISWTIYADNAEARTGMTEFRQISR